jgi:hypothetical protein
MSKDKEHSPDSQYAHNPPLLISHLMRREIQAPIAACIIRGFIKVFGYEKAMEAATTAIQADALEAGRVTAEKFGVEFLEGTRPCGEGGLVRGRCPRDPHVGRVRREVEL